MCTCVHVYMCRSKYRVMRHAFFLRIAARQSLDRPLYDCNAEYSDKSVAYWVVTWIVLTWIWGSAAPGEPTREGRAAGQLVTSLPNLFSVMELGSNMAGTLGRADSL